MSKKTINKKGYTGFRQIDGRPDRTKAPLIKQSNPEVISDTVSIEVPVIPEVIKETVIEDTVTASGFPKPKRRQDGN